MTGIIYWCIPKSFRGCVILEIYSCAKANIFFFSDFPSLTELVNELKFRFLNSHWLWMHPLSVAYFKSLILVGFAFAHTQKQCDDWDTFMINDFLRNPHLLVHTE